MQEVVNVTRSLRTRLRFAAAALRPPASQHGALRRPRRSPGESSGAQRDRAAALAWVCAPRRRARWPTTPCFLGLSSGLREKTLAQHSTASLLTMPAAFSAPVLPLSKDSSGHICTTSMSRCSMRSCNRSWREQEQHRKHSLQKRVQPRDFMTLICRYS